MRRMDFTAPDWDQADISANNARPAVAGEASSVAAIRGNAKEEWDRSLHQAASAEPDDREEVTKRNDLVALTNRLRHQIERACHQHAGMSSVANVAASRQQQEINILMSMIAGLSGTLNNFQPSEAPDHQQVAGAMQSLNDRLSSQRRQQRSDRSQADDSLGGLRREQAAMAGELAAIHQQLAAIQARVNALGRS